ncbi:ParB/RepB/Spo0J family partition protein [Histidinibacterium lentulum]|uniref:ParB/RepB/Spo0J family partition protein n=1 Tax=Histidinibacterium lentulum TaxID=2480588 RepID=A0A3N2QR50_9RHOB|nr:ParB/RepB/Spo0J family partition protein [Histidinibacterium lentulum]ROT97674.1 ParB/RepB/Spo0J family partition protein [Histidinibacterium lentulum]
MTSPLDDALSLTEPAFLLLSDIDPDAFLRDRSAMDEDALAELMGSIVAHGLRQPVEVTETGATPPYALVSGRRRYEAMQRTGYTKIPALIRPSEDPARILAAIVEENEVREDISPWDRGRVIFDAVEQGYFQTVEEAVQRLHPGASKQKRARLRQLAEVVAQMEPHLPDPESWQQAQLLRVAAALSAGHFELMVAAIRDLEPPRSPVEIGAVLDRIAAEALADPKLLRDDRRKGRPRRRVSLRPKLTCRREYLREGWCLRFSGPDATGALMEEIMDAIERDFTPSDWREGD